VQHIARASVQTCVATAAEELQMSTDSDGRPPAPTQSRVADSGVSRRSFIQTLGASAAVGALSARAEESMAQGAPAPDGPETIGPKAARVTLRVNGRNLDVEIDPAETLMETLRWRTGLTGTKEVCDRGACGACSVLLDGKLVTSCMTLTADAVGAEITTVEGLADGENLDPIQLAFIEHDGLQCGFCTPGLVMACKALLSEHPRPSLEQIKHGLSGNICRCGTYTNVFNAVLTASGQRPLTDGEANNG
jgi:aerobic-type carbon monoxide dehydrogenase small subunit (CoxS/CutS family)